MTREIETKIPTWRHVRVRLDKSEAKKIIPITARIKFTHRPNPEPTRSFNKVKAERPKGRLA